MPFLKLVGSHRGDIRITPEGIEGGTPGAREWVGIVARLLPDVHQLSYDTAGGAVDLHHTGSSDAVAAGVDTLLTVAAQSAIRFMLADRDRLRQMREGLSERLDRTPVDITGDGAADRLQRILDEL